MRIVLTTDGRHLGLVIPSVNTGDTLDLEGFPFEVQKVTITENGIVLLSNPNYQLACEEM